MNPSSLYENDHSRLLQRLRHDADAQAAKATQYSTALTEARAACADAETEFFDSLSQDALTQYALAKRWEADVLLAVQAIENCGGAKQIRARHLDTPTVFSTLSLGFKERVSVLERLVQPARKRVSARVSLLIEHGVPVTLAHNDPHVAELRTYLARIESELAIATFGKTYADARGQNYDPKSFDELFEELTRALPTPPPEPAV